jgi:uncharacterized protein YcbK (DUF882 family)
MNVNDHTTRRCFVNGLIHMVGLGVLANPATAALWSSRHKGKARSVKTEAGSSKSNLATQQVQAPFLNTNSNGAKFLSSYNIHTGEFLKKCVFFEDGRFVPESMAAIEQHFRDHRTDDVHKIDPQLIQLIHSIQSTIGTKQPIHLVSGYRSHSTNGMLRSACQQVAKKSTHMEGKAADLYIEGVSHKTVQRAALHLGRGGVGRYGDFVHIDTGRVRRWGLGV